MRSLGFDEVHTGVAHTGAVGVLKGGKPGGVVALRADLDALPVEERSGLPFASKVRAEYNGVEVPVMHACGHDAHTAILMGVATMLAGMREQIPGTVSFVFQPAEEGPPAGEEGGDRPPDPRIAALGRRRPDCGVGKDRAGAAVDPEPPARHHQGARSGHDRHDPRRDGHNIIPDAVEMTGTIRTFDEGVRKELLARIERTAKDIASSSGATAEVAVTPRVGITYNDAALTARMQPTLEAAAEGKLVNGSLIMASEDFADYQRDIPGLFIFLGVNRDGVAAGEAAANHSPEYFVNEAALVPGARTLAMLALHYLSQPGS